MNIDTKLRIAILAVLVVILYILLPFSSRYEYRIANTYTGTFLVEPGDEPVALSGSSMIVRRRKW